MRLFFIQLIYEAALIAELNQFSSRFLRHWHACGMEDVMANIYKGTLGLIGNTPLVEVENIEKELNLPATLLVKLEYLNPAGSD